MCGIFCCYNRQGDLASFRPRAIALSKLQRHRGPDWSGCYMSKDTVMVHERLAIVGVGECIGLEGWGGRGRP
jgi:asparagine synthase (glutamine-hydrolysing)